VGSHAYVIDIPAAIARAPHQASDNKYYKRQNFQSVPMEDYEIRDVFRRARTPDLFAKIRFENGRTVTDVKLAQGTDKSEPIQIQVILGNNSSEPAYYSIFICILTQGYSSISMEVSFREAMCT
jgi:hypothetical protein